jgi:hypothetical protein
MIENVPTYVSMVFILNTFATVGIMFNAVRRTGSEKFPARFFAFAVWFWIFFTGVLSVTGFYAATEAIPPRVFAFGALPGLILALVYLAFFRNAFLDRLPLRALTLLHTVRLPVEIVLLWLFQAGLVPQVMTFEGRNFDIFSGLTAPFVAWLAFRGGKTRRGLLLIWNIVAFGLLINIVVTAIAAFPSPFQQTAFDQPNRAVIYFPFIWLPSIVVPMVFFSHIAAFRQLLRSTNEPEPAPKT